VCYAILFRNWEPRAAVDYARACCLRERTYYQPRPLHNAVFVNFLLGLTPARDGSLAPPAPTALDAWLVGSRSSDKKKKRQQSSLCIEESAAADDDASKEGEEAPAAANDEKKKKKTTPAVEENEE